MLCMVTGSYRLITKDLDRSRVKLFVVRLMVGRAGCFSMALVLRIPRAPYRPSMVVRTFGRVGTPFYRYLMVGF